MEKRFQTKMFLSQGKSQCEIARILSISRKSVQIISKKIDSNISVEDRPKSGRPKVLNTRDERSLIIASKKAPFKTARQLQSDSGLTNKSSLSTIKRVLRRNNLFGRIAAPKPQLNAKQKQKRLAFAKNHKEWNATDWGKVIFSDECKLELHPRRREFVRRPPNSRYNSKYVRKTTKFSPGVMVWGAIRSDGKRIISRCPANIDSSAYQRILDSGFETIYNTRWIFQQDGASSHTSKSTMEYLTNKSIRLLPNFPPQSPDLTIIENMWDLLKTKVKERNPSNLNDLWKFSVEEWHKIPQDTISKLFGSLPDRIAATVKARGGNTKY